VTQWSIGNTSLHAVVGKNPCCS